MDCWQFFLRFCLLQFVLQLCRGFKTLQLTSILFILLVALIFCGYFTLMVARRRTRLGLSIFFAHPSLRGHLSFLFFAINFKPCLKIFINNIRCLLCMFGRKLLAETAIFWCDSWFRCLWKHFVSFWRHLSRRVADWCFLSGLFGGGTCTL